MSDFSSPYLGEINAQAIQRSWRKTDIETVTLRRCRPRVGELRSGRADTLTKYYDLACQADHPDAQAIVLSCTDMRSVEAITHIEATLDKPVVTSNQAMMFGLMKALNLPRHDSLPGRLFDKF